jgi:hypothetical protein
MECHACGAPVIEGQKFCQECGESLAGVTDSTERLDMADVSAADAPTGDTEDDDTDAGAVVAGAAAAAVPLGTEPSPPEPAAAEPSPSPPEPAAVEMDPSAVQSTTYEPTTDAAPPTDENALASAEEKVDDPATTTPPSPDDAVLPALSDLPTQAIDPREPLPDPMWADPQASAEGTDPAAIAAAAAVGAAVAGASPETPTQPAPHPAGGDASQLDATLAELGATPPPADSTEVLDATPTPQSEPLATAEVAAISTDTTVLSASDVGTTDEFPAVFDGSEDVHQFPPGREPFKLRLMFVLAFFGAVATLMSSAADLTDIRTSTPIDGINIGITTLADVGVNLPIAGFTGAVVMTLGGLLACYGFRWGAGLAGGGGLALAGWAGLTIGLVEKPIAVAESITRTDTTQQFTLTVTRDLGFWLIVAAGVIGLLVFAASLRMAGTGGRRSLNPWVAAVGAVSAVILAAGPLIPEGSASFSDNFRSPSALIDLPTAYFAGRLGQVALIAVAGVVGFLLVRAYGLGLAAGGISVAFWMWLSALLGIGEDLGAGDVPLGIAAGNFGAGDNTPHGVTTVGMVLTLLMLLIAAVMAVVQYRRDSQRY